MDRLQPELTTRQCFDSESASAPGTLGCLLLCLLAASACGFAGGGDRQSQTGAIEGVARPALANTLDSPEALAREVLAGLARQDREHLEALAVTDEEFRTVVWPRLPSSRPEVGMPVEYLWRDLHSKSIGHLRTTLDGFRGAAPLTFAAIRFRGETTDYGDFRVHRRSVIEVRDPSGSPRRIRVFGSMIEQGGRVKVFSYVVD